MKNCLTLLLSLLALPALAGETEDALVSRVTFAVPAGLCAMPANETGDAIFARLDQIQRDIGNRLVALYPTCEDAETIKAGGAPGFSHYAAVATVGQAVTARIDVSREQVISDTATTLSSGNAGDVAARVVENAQDSLKEMGIRNIELSQPVSYIGQDDLAIYALLRQRVSSTDKNSTEVMGVLSATSFNGIPVFVYYYDTPPTKESSVRLYEANKAYLAELDRKNML